jgi:hypothetical protein
MSRARTSQPSPTALVWGVRASFVRYVEATGSIDVIEPATRDAAGRLHFPASGADGSTLRFSGGATFLAHHGALTLTLRDPWIESSDEPGGLRVLSALDVSAFEPQGSRVVVAELGPSGSARLTETGVGLFGFHYPAGAALEPVVLERAC